MQHYQQRTKVVTAPAYYPVTRDEVKGWVGVDSTDTTHDTAIDLLIKACTNYAENYTGRAFIKRTLRSYQPNWANVIERAPTPLPRMWEANWWGEIVLPTAPLISVSEIQYYDVGGTLQTLDLSQYLIHDFREPCVIVPAWAVSWPPHRPRHDAIQIEFVAGYAPGSPDDENGNQEVQPPELKVWLQARISTLFDNREHIMAASNVAVPRDIADGVLDDLVLGLRLF